MHISELLWSISIIVVFCKNVSGESLKPLIHTPGCVIPNLVMKFQDDDIIYSCEERSIEVTKLGSTIVFNMKMHYENCCYKYMFRSTAEFFEDTNVTFSDCIPFQNQTVANLTNDFINIECRVDNHTVYNDYYAFVSPIKETPKEAPITENPAEVVINGTQLKTDVKPVSRDPLYNVLVIVLDNMSRARAWNSLPKTTKFLNESGWFDYRGYNKVAQSTVANMMALLTGRGESLSAFENCSTDMTTCQNMFIWHQFKKRGFITAYGTDSLPAIEASQHKGNRFSKPPTDHYMTPVLLHSIKQPDGAVCSGHMLSGIRTLNYILDFMSAYKDRKDKKLFGFFRIRSFSRDYDQSPKIFDATLLDFFTTLRKTGVFDNTFIMFVSDHGMRFGPVRYPVASYYDERLPMLFMNVPTEVSAPAATYENLEANQRRLISPFDLYLTLWDMLKFSTGEIMYPRAYDCPKCKSLFRHIPDDRICSNAGIPEEWCSCHSMNETSLDEFGAMYSLVRATTYVIERARYIATEQCTKCIEMSFDKTLRMHTFAPTGNLTKYYVGAFAMKPFNATYEAIVHKLLNKTENSYYYKIDSVQLISDYKGKGWCALDIKDKHFCQCEYILDCVPTISTPAPTTNIWMYK